MRVDTGLLDALRTYLTMHPQLEGHINATRYFSGCPEWGLCRNHAKSEDLDCLRNPSQLNDVCINLVSAVIHSNLWDESTSKCAIFSSYIMTYIEDDTNPDTVWNNTQFLSYWEQKVWLVPIHQQAQHHWMLCIIYVDKGEMHIFIFNSFGSQESCHSILKVSLSTTHVDCTK